MTVVPVAYFQAVRCTAPHMTRVCGRYKTFMQRGHRLHPEDKATSNIPIIIHNKNKGNRVLCRKNRIGKKMLHYTHWVSNPSRRFKYPEVYLKPTEPERRDRFHSSSILQPAQLHHIYHVGQLAAKHLETRVQVVPTAGPVTYVTAKFTELVAWCGTVRACARRDAVVRRFKEELMNQ